MITIAINGFGRIGKSFLRTLLTKGDQDIVKKIKIAVINIGKGDIQSAVYALKYDTLMGTLPYTIEFTDTMLSINGYVIDIIAELDPSKISWKKYGVDWVVESSGHFTNRIDAEKHLQAGAKNVLITAPAHAEDITVIMGTNEHLFDPNKHHIVSLGSCTTNALVTMLNPLVKAFTIEYVSMTTIHAYTNTQVLLDVDPQGKDLRKARAAALNIIPTSTGAMQLIGRIMPALQAKVTGVSLRVPIAKVSLIDLTFSCRTTVTSNALNTIFEKTAQSGLKNILAFTKEPLVSSDYSGNSHSVVIDGLMTEGHDTYGKVFGWYDNEWAYAMRIKDFLLFLCN
jgi:glyceraldehyde 3-phosphate dehydrogenase